MTLKKQFELNGHDQYLHDYDNAAIPNGITCFVLVNYLTYNAVLRFLTRKTKSRFYNSIKYKKIINMKKKMKFKI